MNSGSRFVLHFRVCLKYYDMYDRNFFPFQLSYNENSIPNTLNNDLMLRRWFEKYPCKSEKDCEPYEGCFNEDFDSEDESLPKFCRPTGRNCDSIDNCPDRYNYRCILAERWGEKICQRKIEGNGPEDGKKCDSDKECGQDELCTHESWKQKRCRKKRSHA